MPLSPPLTEEEKAFQPILHTFLAHANTQGLHSIVDKHGRETEAVGKDLAALREAFNTLQSQRNEDHQRIIELQSKVEKLQGANEELRTTNGELRGVNEEIRLSNEKLRHDNGKLPIVSDKAVETVNALEKKVDLALNNFVDKLETAIGHTRTATQDLRSRFDQLHGDTQALQNIQKQMRMYDDRLGDTEFRQQNVEEVVEKLANMVNVSPTSQGLLQEPLQEAYQDSHTQSNHTSRKRHYTYNRDDEQADPQYGEGSKRHARDSYQDDACYRPTEPSKKPPHLAHQDAVKAEKSTAQRPTTRGAPARAQNQPEANVPNDTDTVNPRWLAIKDHYIASKKQFAASKPKNQRNFIWAFIEGSGDNEFCTWFQEHLLEALPSDKVNRSSKKSRNPGDRIVALGRTLTWDEVRQVIRDMPVAPFLE